MLSPQMNLFTWGRCLSASLPGPFLFSLHSQLSCRYLSIYLFSFSFYYCWGDGNSP